MFTENCSTETLTHQEEEVTMFRPFKPCLVCESESIFEIMLNFAHFLHFDIGVLLLSYAEFLTSLIYLES